MENLHPTIQQAFAPHLTPPPQSHDREVMAQVLGFQRCSHVSPNPERGTQRFEYTLGGIDLACDIEFERAQGDGWNEPHEPAMATLCAAYVRDVDIYELLDDGQRAQIEEAYLCQDVSDL